VNPVGMHAFIIEKFDAREQQKEKKKGTVSLARECFKRLRNSGLKSRPLKRPGEAVSGHNAGKDMESLGSKRKRFWGLASKEAVKRGVACHSK